MTLKAHSRGFTLVELLVVLAMLGIIITAVYSIFITHQRTAYVDEEVVDVQQNLRIAVDSISKDIMMSGFLVADDSAPDPNPGVGLTDSTVPVGRYDNNTGLVQESLPPPNNIIQSDSLTLNMASADHVYAKITAEVNTPVAPGTNIILPIDSADYFAVDVPPQVVRIYDSGNYSEPRDAGGNIDSRTYTVSGVLTAAGSCGVLTPPCLMLNAGGATATAITYAPGYVIARINDALAPIPNRVQYSLVAGVTCPSGPFCLQRAVAGSPVQVIAMNIAGLQFSYLLDNGEERPNSINPLLGPANLSEIRAVRVTIWGQAEGTRRLSGETREGIIGNPLKTRQVSSVVKLRNRFNR